VRTFSILGWFRGRTLAAMFVISGFVVALVIRDYRLPRHGRVAMLNRLQDEINANYRYLDGFPRVNRGPCGPFAKAFREQWNARFREKANIAFVMPDDGRECCHVLVRLPDGSYFDGGNGVMSEGRLLSLHRDCRIEEMVDFDSLLLNQRSGGLDRNYGRCPNYSESLTSTIIKNHLALLPSDIDVPRSVCESQRAKSDRHEHQ
jgi:hypothetical protein